MTVVLCIVGGLVLLFVINAFTNGKLRFWRMVNNHPDFAFDFFVQHSETFWLDCSEEPRDTTHFNAGPFYMIYNGCKVTIYANAETLLEKQAEFMQLVKVQ